MSDPRNRVDGVGSALAGRVEIDTLSMMTLQPDMPINTYGAFHFVPPRPHGMAPWLVCRVGLPTPLIHVPAVTNVQYQHQWCWAACIATVFAYFGHPVTQERIVFDAFGSVVDMPANREQILDELSGDWYDDYGRPFRVESGEGWAYVRDIINDLKYDCPLIVGTLGHAMVLSALEYRILRMAQGRSAVRVVAAIVRDPWPGGGRRVLTPEEWRSIDLAARIRVIST